MDRNKTQEIRKGQHKSKRSEARELFSHILWVFSIWRCNNKRFDFTISDNNPNNEHNITY